jgi:regulator of sigma E protease
MLTWIAPVLVFGLVIFVHELGHFLAAKAAGVYTPRFSIGFGPALFKRRYGETEYVLALLPLGGYVRMASRDDDAMALIEGGGETPPEELPTTGANAAGKVVDEHAGAPRRRSEWDPDAMYPFGPKQVPPNRWFESKSLPARLVILLAGVTMNILLAWVIQVGAAATYGRPYTPAVIDSVLPGRPAALAGLQRGDSIVAVNGVRVETWSQVVDRIRPSAGRPLSLEVQRPGAGRREFRVQPEQREAPDLVTGVPEQVGQIGAAPRAQLARTPLSFGEAVRVGSDSTLHLGLGIVSVVRGLFAGDVPASQVGGPIAIVAMTVAVAKTGFEQLLGLISFLSVNIAVLNLLPIPVLDGGQILLNVLEGIKGSAFSARTREYILRTGVLAVLLLFCLVMFNDLRALVARLVS